MIIGSARLALILPHSIKIVMSAVKMSLATFSVPSPVAMHSEHPPDTDPSAPYSDGLGSSLGGPATVSVSDNATSLPRMVFADLLATVQLLGGSGRVPDSFLDTLRSYVIVAPEFNVIINGASLAYSIHAFPVPDPFHPVPGPSQGEDGVDPYLYHLVAFFGVVIARRFER